MGKFIDLTGQRFGRLLVVKRVENQNKRVCWLCKCDCGNEIVTTTNNLRSGDSQSCGCRNKDILKQRAIDLTGQRFGRWTVLSRSENTKRDVTTWLCKCDCGTIRVVNGINLRSGATNSCGCLNSELISERNSIRFEQVSLVGQRFGKLLVIERTDERDNGQVVYKCQCDCGNTTTVRGSRLVEGSKQSCGCLSSKGEELIARILRENSVPYTQQKTFEDCRNPETNAMFRFDFWINQNYLLEYDGEQHFREISFGRDNLEERQMHDKLKNEYCKEHNISLIRIPYTRYEKLCLDDLLLETSKFVV